MEDVNRNLRSDYLRRTHRTSADLSTSPETPRDQDRQRRLFLPRRRLLSLAAIAGAGTLTNGVAGCSSGSQDTQSELDKKINNPPDNLNRKGFPIVDKPVTFHFMTGRRPLSAKDYNNVASWKKYQQMSNIKISWGLISDESIEEKRNLALGSDDYPEAFHSCQFSAADVAKYGTQGQFIVLNDLIDKYMPNLKKVMDDYVPVRRGLVFPDDNIYSMPLIYDPKFTGLHISRKLWARGDWLDKFDMDIPATTHELHKYLKAVKKAKPRAGAIPYGDYDKLSLTGTLGGSFGVRNRCRNYIDSDPKNDDKVRFYPITDGYKELIEYLHRLYREGLIASNIFSIDTAKARNAIRDGVYGCTNAIAPRIQLGGKHYVSLPALKGPHGHHEYTSANPALMGVGNFVITDRCEHPLETARWMDYFYSDAGSILFLMGVKGKSYKQTKDGPKYLDKIENSSKGFVQALRPYTTINGGGYPGILKENTYAGSEASKESIKAAKKLEPDLPSEIWPEFTQTAEEYQRLGSLSDDIEKYVDESTDRFISGDLSLSNWSKYVDKLKKMGLDEYIEIRQAAYDRYKKK